MTLFSAPAAYAASPEPAEISRGEFMNLLYKTHVDCGGQTAYQQFPPSYGELVDESSGISTEVIAPGSGFGSLLYFGDVLFNSDYYVSSAWGYKNGIVNGVSEWSFAPDESMTREQLAVILQRYCTAMEIELPQEQEETRFADAEKISDWAIAPLAEMNKAGIILGKSGNIFDPQGRLTVAEAELVLKRQFSITHSIADAFTYNHGFSLSYEQISEVRGGIKIVSTYAEYLELFPNSTAYRAQYFEDKILIFIAWMDSTPGYSHIVSIMQPSENEVIFEVTAYNDFGDPLAPRPTVLSPNCFTLEASRIFLDYEMTCMFLDYETICGF